MIKELQPARCRACDLQEQSLLQKIEAGLSAQPGFIKNKFLSHYAKLIAKRKLDKPKGPIEKHHVLPKSVGGSDAKDNLVHLTPREHFVAHRLLLKCTSGKTKRSMSLALSLFMTRCGNHKREVSSRQYQIARAAVKRSISFYHFIDGRYCRHEDFYRFCDDNRIGRANLQAKLSQNQIAVITAGKHKGRAFSLVDVGPTEMLAAVQQQLDSSKQSRSCAVSKQWEKQSKQIVRRRTVTLCDASGKIWQFDSMAAAQSATSIPWTTLQSCKKAPHTFRRGAAAGWTLLEIKGVRSVS